MIHQDDADVRQLVASDLDRNFLVEAGAGTGKTTLLVDRIVSLIASGKQGIGSVAAITFTRKAAQELSGRVKIALVKAKAETNSADVERRLSNAIYQFRRCHIQTIHSFAATLLRSAPVAHLDQRLLQAEFEVVDSVVAESDFEVGFQRWWLELPQSSPQVFGLAVSAGVSAKIAFDLAVHINERRDLIPLNLIDSDNSLDWSTWLAEIRPIIEELDALGRQAQSSSSIGTAKSDDPSFRQIRNLAQFLALARESTGTTAERHRRPQDCSANEASNANGSNMRVGLGLRPRWILTVAALPQDDERNERLPATAAEQFMTHEPQAIRLFNSKAAWPDPASFTRQRQLCRELRGPWTRAKDALRLKAVQALLPLIEEFVQDQADERYSTGAITPDDLLIAACELLRTGPDVRRWAHGRFRTILIDEFQDTDHRQVQLLLYLTSNSFAQTDWRDLRPEPGRLFAVGDPKQSIYRFRQADLATYDWVKTHIFGTDGTGANRTVAIRRNFRSTPDLIATFNCIFDNLFVEESGVQPANTGLIAGRSDSARSMPSVVLLRPDVPIADETDVPQGQSPTEIRKTQQELRQLEATLLAREIQQSSGPASDIAVLLRAGTDVDIYAATFRQHGIAVQLEVDKRFCDRPEVQALLQVLRAISNPDSEIATIAALRSFVMGCSDRELYEARLAGTTFSPPVTPPASAPEGIQQGLSLLAALSVQAADLSLADFIDEVVAQTQLRKLVSAMAIGDAAIANIELCRNFARRLDKDETGTVARYIELLAASDESPGALALSIGTADTAAPEEIDLAESVDAVRIMTIHAAKGLEFPVVALANLTTEHRSSPRAYVDADDRTLSFRYRGGDGYVYTTGGFEERKSREDAKAAAEARRLLYVAMTRARDLLILPDAGSTKGLARELFAQLDSELSIHASIARRRMIRCHRRGGSESTWSRAHSASNG